jgi:hypothetical protein
MLVKISVFKDSSPLFGTHCTQEIYSYWFFYPYDTPKRRENAITVLQTENGVQQLSTSHSVNS